MSVPVCSHAGAQRSSYTEHVFWWTGSNIFEERHIGLNLHLLFQYWIVIPILKSSMRCPGLSAMKATCARKIMIHSNSSCKSETTKETRRYMRGDPLETAILIWIMNIGLSSEPWTLFLSQCLPSNRQFPLWARTLVPSSFIVFRI